MSSTALDLGLNQNIMHLNELFLDVRKTKAKILQTVYTVRLLPTVTRIMLTTWIAFCKSTIQLAYGWFVQLELGVIISCETDLRKNPIV